MLVVAIWGANAAIGKLAVPQIPVFAFLAIRFLITGLLFLPFVKWQNLPWAGLCRVTVLLNILHFGLVFSAMARISASSLAIILQIQTPVTVLLAYVIFHERLSLRLWMGILLGFAGLLLVKGFGSIEPLGFGLALAGAFAWSMAGIEMKRMRSIPLPSFMSLTTLMATPFLMLMSYARNEPVLASMAAANWYQVGAALTYQVILGSLAMMAWKFLLGANEVQKIVPITLLQPLFGVAGGIILFSDNLTGIMIIGGVLTAIGVALIQLPQRRKADVL